MEKVPTIVSTESYRLAGRTTLREDAYEALERLIIEGRLQPGQRLVETELAAELGISRSPLREALNALRHAGWVEFKPRQGSFVRVPSRREVEQFFHVRALLECETARLMASHPDPEACRQLKEIAERGKDLRVDVDSGLSNNSAFHTAIAAGAGNAFLAEMCASLDKRLRWHTGPLPERGGQACEEHVRLSELIGQGDPESAVKLMRAHVMRTAETVLGDYGNA